MTDQIEFIQSPDPKDAHRCRLPVPTRRLPGVTRMHGPDWVGETTPESPRSPGGAVVAPRDWVGVVVRCQTCGRQWRVRSDGRWWPRRSWWRRSR